MRRHRGPRAQGRRAQGPGVTRPMATMHVELVSVERALWSGEATAVFARTTEGELGILPGHIPLLGALEPGWTVRIDREGEGRAEGRGARRLPVGARGRRLGARRDGGDGRRHRRLPRPRRARRATATTRPKARRRAIARWLGCAPRANRSEPCTECDRQVSPCTPSTCSAVCAALAVIVLLMARCWPGSGTCSGPAGGGPGGDAGARSPLDVRHRAVRRRRAALVPGYRGRHPAVQDHATAAS